MIGYGRFLLFFLLADAHGAVVAPPLAWCVDPFLESDDEPCGLLSEDVTMRHFSQERSNVIGDGAL